MFAKFLNKILHPSGSASDVLDPLDAITIVSDRTVEDPQFGLNVELYRKLMNTIGTGMY
ncbi:MAG: hypothetical protein OEY79_02220 [Anaplasmataceae bacterium]|nr:hypothetical protein [Anaplasmataceae bacterium]